MASALSARLARPLRGRAPRHARLATADRSDTPRPPPWRVRCARTPIDATGATGRGRIRLWGCLGRCGARKRRPAADARLAGLPARDPAARGPRRRGRLANAHPDESRVGIRCPAWDHRCARPRCRGICRLDRGARHRRPRRPVRRHHWSDRGRRRVGTVIVGLVRSRARDHPTAEGLLLAGGAMLVPSPVAWVVAGGAWVGVAVVGLRPVRPLRPV